MDSDPVSQRNVVTVSSLPILYLSIDMFTVVDTSRVGWSGNVPGRLPPQEVITSVLMWISV